jgi:hypothetical protein
MAHVIGSAGKTAEHVEADRLLLLVTDRSRSVAVAALAAGTGAFAWATRWIAVPALVSMSFALALAGLAWMLASATPPFRVVARSAGRRMHAITLAADVALAAGIGGVAGASAPQPLDSSGHLWTGVAGALVTGAATWWRVRAAASGLGRLLAGRTGEDRVANELKRLPDDYVVFNDLVLDGPGGTCEVDHLVLGPTGIYVIEVKRWSGLITPGKNATDAWLQQNRRGAISRPSPAVQLERGQRAIAARLGVPMGAVVPILVLVGGQLTAPAPVRTETPSSLRRAVASGPPSWLLERSPIEAAQAFLSEGQPN